MAKQRTGKPSPQHVLGELGAAAVELARTARRNNKSLKGSNFYAYRLADLRAKATNTFKQLSSESVGDTTMLAELIETCFSSDAAPDARRDALRERRVR